MGLEKGVPKSLLAFRSERIEAKLKWGQNATLFTFPQHSSH